jgi:protein-S-isoprenylcysteine O-methyltransferase Ste14
MPHFQNEQGKRKTPANPIARARSRTIIGDIVLVLILFIASRDLAWWPAWAYVAMLFVSSLLPLCGPFRFDKGLIEERLSRKPDAKRWDRYFVGMVAVFTIAELIVPGLDHRFGWTAPREPWTQLSGLILALLGTAGLLWAMKVNRFFSALIRIQKDRQHCVVSDGPYRMVRHPGYAFWCLRTLGIPMLFGSDWTFIVAFLFIAMFVVRTMLEDRLLLEELPGYREYAARVRWKLVGCLW